MNEALQDGLAAALRPRHKHFYRAVAAGERDRIRREGLAAGTVLALLRQQLLAEQAAELGGEVVLLRVPAASVLARSCWLAPPGEQVLAELLRESGLDATAGVPPMLLLVAAEKSGLLVCRQAIPAGEVEEQRQPIPLSNFEFAHSFGPLR